MTTGVDAVLAASRAGVTRLDPHQAAAAVAAGALLVDTRTDAQRAEQGDDGWHAADHDEQHARRR